METSFAWPTAILLAVSGCYLILIYISFRIHQRNCARCNFSFTLIDALYFEEGVMKMLQRVEELNQLSLKKFQESYNPDSVYDRDLFRLKTGSVQQENEMMKLLIVQYAFFNLLPKIRPIDQRFILHGITNPHLPSRQRFINQILQSCGFPATIHIALFEKPSASSRLREVGRNLLAQLQRISLHQPAQSTPPACSQHRVF
jgi:hypothetical protein